MEAGKEVRDECTETLRLAHPSSVFGGVAVWTKFLAALRYHMVHTSTQVAGQVTLGYVERDVNLDVSHNVSSRAHENLDIHLCIYIAC